MSVAGRGVDRPVAPAAVDGIGANGFPQYWPRARRALMRADPVMRTIILGCREVQFRHRGEPFAALARSIVGQQISVRAASTIWERLNESAGAVTPAQIMAMSDARLRAAGLSQRKAEYMQDLARRFAEGGLDPAQWPDQDDATVIAALTQVRGVGRWTAEMFLMFCLLRPDVLPLDDLGLQRAVSRNYRSGRAIAPSTIERIARPWAPWRSVATWYLWRSLEPQTAEA